MGWSSGWHLLCITLVVLGCGTKSDEGSGGGGTDTAPAPVCNEGTKWVAGQQAFREVTTDWGLDGVLGIRLAVTDIDGDGWADLLVRNGGGPDDFSDGGDRSRWVLRNTGEGRFEDVAQASGLMAGRIDTDTATGRPGQTFASGDVDNDGHLDIYVGNSRTDPDAAETETSELMLSNGDGTFRLGPLDSAARFAADKTNPAGVTFVDFDLDGNLDLWITNNEESGPTPLADRLLRGDGEGGFTDVTAERGLTTTPWSSIYDLNNALSHSWAWSGAACDLNNDGLPELLASSYGRSPNHLWRAERSDGGSVAYVNASIESGYAFDHRDDWTQDLNGQCYCADHPTAADCDTCPAPEDYGFCELLASAFGENYRWNHSYSREPFYLGGNSGTTVCADINNDGFFDLMTHEIVHFDVGEPSDPTELMVNLGDALIRFDRPGGEVTGLLRVDESEYWDHGDMTGAVFDFDNDGWQDVYVGASDYPANRSLLFHQQAPMEFQLLEVADYFEHFRAHGVAVADFDRDGDLDLIAGHSRMRCDGFPSSEECGETQQVRLYENLMGQDSNWVQLKLEGGLGSNAAAIGARVSVVSGGVTQTQQVDGGHGHFGMQRDLVLHFGLGLGCSTQVQITWPDHDSSTQTFTVDANQRYRVIQGSDPVVVQGPASE